MKVFFEASKRDDFERDITLRWTGAGEFLRDDRPINFKPGTELPIDHSLRAYCEILHDLTVAGRRKMQIEIMGQKVAPCPLRAPNGRGFGAVHGQFRFPQISRSWGKSN